MISATTFDGLTILPDVYRYLQYVSLGFRAREGALRENLLKLIKHIQKNRQRRKRGQMMR